MFQLVRAIARGASHCRPLDNKLEWLVAKEKSLTLPGDPPSLHDADLATDSLVASIQHW